MAFFVVCSFYGGEFKSLGWHAWRCKEKLKTLENGEKVVNHNGDSCISLVPLAMENSEHVSNCKDVKCCCGQSCNGVHGLMRHQRSCRVIKGLEHETYESLEHCEIETSQNICTDIDWDLLPCIKPGIRLPKSDLDWILANTYFVNALPISGINSSDINNTLQAMNSVIYEYFRENCGMLKDANTLHLIDKYKDCLNNSLESKLKSLKKMNANLVEIKYVAKLL